MSELNPFAGIYARLVQDSFAGPALSVSGMALGWTTIQGGRVLPPPYDDGFGRWGYRLTVACGFLFVCMVAGYSLIWLIGRQKALLTKR